MFHVKQVTTGHDAQLRDLVGGHPVLVFDGACNLCHASVQFALRRDPAGKIRFLAIQSPAGKAFLERNGLPARSYESFYLVDRGEILQKSRAVLRLVRHLRFPWPLLRLFGVLPAFLLDPFYDLIARNRYRWFGRRALCLVPDGNAAERFLT